MRERSVKITGSIQKTLLFADEQVDDRARSVTILHAIKFDDQ